MMLREKSLYGYLAMGLLLSVSLIAGARFTDNETSLKANGVALNGVVLNGVVLNGVVLNGISLNTNQMAPAASVTQRSVRVEGGQLVIQAASSVE
jgi:hypothetical protein